MKKKESLDDVISEKIVEKIENHMLNQVIGGETQTKPECFTLSYEKCHATQDQACGGHDLCTCK
jgi:hypothetical protein